MRWLLPTAVLAAGKAPTCPAAHTAAKGRLGDGVCDAALNNAGCGFDLGDCCASTSTGRGPFESCADPAEVEFDAGLRRLKCHTYWRRPLRSCTKHGGLHL